MGIIQEFCPTCGRTTINHRAEQAESALAVSQDRVSKLENLIHDACVKLWGINGEPQKICKWLECKAEERE